MKTYKKSYLPDSIIYKGHELKLNAFMSSGMNATGTKPNVISKTLKQRGRLGVLVLVLSRNLKGKTDLHGNPYEPTKFIFSN